MDGFNVQVVITYVSGNINQIRNDIKIRQLGRQQVKINVLFAI